MVSFQGSYSQMTEFTSSKQGKGSQGLCPTPLPFIKTSHTATPRCEAGVLEIHTVWTATFHRQPHPYDPYGKEGLKTLWGHCTSSPHDTEGAHNAVSTDAHGVQRQFILPGKMMGGFVEDLTFQLSHQVDEGKKSKQETRCIETERHETACRRYCALGIFLPSLPHLFGQTLI